MPNPFPRALVRTDGIVQAWRGGAAGERLWAVLEQKVRAIADKVWNAADARHDPVETWGLIKGVIKSAVQEFFVEPPRRVDEWGTDGMSAWRVEAGTEEFERSRWIRRAAGARASRSWRRGPTPTSSAT